MIIASDKLKDKYDVPIRSFFCQNCMAGSFSMVLINGSKTHCARSKKVNLCDDSNFQELN